MFPEVFFHFSFPRPKFRKKPMAKKRKMEAYRSVLLSECQNIAAFVPESGCKSRAFTDICKIYTSFFWGFTWTSVLEKKNEKKLPETFGSYVLKFLPLHPLLKTKAARVDILLSRNGDRFFFFLFLFASLSTRETTRKEKKEK